MRCPLGSVFTPLLLGHDGYWVPNAPETHWNYLGELVSLPRDVRTGLAGAVGAALANKAKNHAGGRIGLPVASVNACTV